MMFSENKTKSKDRTQDGDTDFFDIVAGVLHRYSLASYVQNMP